MHLQNVPKSLAVLLGLSIAACAAGSVHEDADTGDASVAVVALQGSDVKTVTLTISGGGHSIITPLTPAGMFEWHGIIGKIPVGTYTFTASAKDVNNTEIYAGTAPNVEIVARQKAQVTITAQQVEPPPAFQNTVPVIDSLVVSATDIAPGDQVTLVVTAHDADKNDALTYAWSASDGTFGTPGGSTTTYTAGSDEGQPTLTVLVTDTKCGVTEAQVKLDVKNSHGKGSADVKVTLNTWPIVTGATADKGRIDVGETVVVSVAAVDPDNDSLYYTWSTSCTGDSAPSGATMSFTLTSLTATSCDFNVVIGDGRGGQNSADLVIGAGAPLAPSVPPQIVSTYQSETSIVVPGGVVLRVGAVPSGAGPVTFDWSASSGALTSPTNGTGTSEVSWTSPTSGKDTATITVVVTDLGTGLKTSAIFTVAYDIKPPTP